MAEFSEGVCWKQTMKFAPDFRRRRSDLSPLVPQGKYLFGIGAGGLICEIGAVGHLPLGVTILEGYCKVGLF